MNMVGLVVATAMLANSAMTAVTWGVALVVGSGTGGIIGGVIALKRFKLERQAAAVNGTVSLRTVDVEQFKAMFPGGLGDAVEHWREEAKGLYVEVDELRKQRQIDHETILQLTTQRQADHDTIVQLTTDLAATQVQLAATTAQLTTTKVELEQAKSRISHLETDR